MISKDDKEKNVKDLEYNLLLHKQNIILILIGTAIISISLSDSLVFGLPKIWLIVFLFLLGLIFLSYYSNKLEEKTQEIRGM
ncbi:hypothetical protein HY212_06490 [Candidatus Pacearchaeota archaeon]|nr:hypothetical protein [Candidatus Pacearchaeota archaeon]